nr:cobalt ABC transporter permease [Aliiruegeria haliotis]
MAHKVIASVFPSGTAIEGEVGLSNGEMAANTLVEVFDSDGAKLGEAWTDGEGFFLFQPTEPVAHIFRADLGAGHVAEITMIAEDVAEIVGKATGPDTPAAGATIAFDSTPAEGGTAPAAGAAAGIAYAPTISVAALTDDEKAAIAKIVRDETRPLRKEIAAYKEKNDLQSILGGIGYIVGLFGIGFYLAARRKLKEASA